MIGALFVLAAAAASPATDADRAAIDRLMTDTYAVISGPPGQKRDFDKMRAMFAPNAMLRVVTPTGVKGGTLDDYITKNGPVLEKEGFYETELGRRVELYGSLAHAWSAYDGRTADGKWHERGINSFQLVKIDGQWKVASILWVEEKNAGPIPADLIGDAQK